jgi:hypothetical protein
MCQYQHLLKVLICIGNKQDFWASVRTRRSIVVQKFLLCTKKSALAQGDGNQQCHKKQQ